MEETTSSLWREADHGWDTNESEQERRWAELPFDLLHSIVSNNLLAGDRFSFRAVCKSWQSVSVDITRRPLAVATSAAAAFQTLPQSLNQTPCLILPRKKLFHPIMNASFNLDDEAGVILSDAVIRASKYNWLLMTRGKRRIFFFNPFTKVRVDLPYYPTGSKGMTFSAPPTSSDCVVIVLEGIVDNNAISLLRIKIGEIYWRQTIVVLDNIPDAKLSLHCNPVWCGSCYYHLGMLGDVFAYNVDKNKCFWTLSSSKAIRELLLSHPSCERYLIEDDGDLLAVFMASDGGWIQVYRFLTDELEWEAVNQLKDKALYVSPPGSFCEPSPLRGASNKIYFPRFREDNDYSLFYSLATKKYHTFNGGSYNNFLNSKMPLYTTWIKFGCNRAC